MPFKDLREVFIHELNDLYSAERQIAEQMPELIRAVHDESLRKTLREHGGQTMTQLQRLEKVFKTVGAKPGKDTSPGMNGILSQAESLIQRHAAGSDPAAFDCAITAVAQRVEHYEIGGYMAARKHAEVLQLPRAQQILDDLLREELLAHQNLVSVSQDGLSQRAAGQPEPNQQQAGAA